MPTAPALPRRPILSGRLPGTKTHPTRSWVWSPVRSVPGGVIGLLEIAHEGKTRGADTYAVEREFSRTGVPLMQFLVEKRPAAEAVPPAEGVYRVSLPAGYCSCPGHECRKGGYVCKHLAGLLAVAAEGGLEPDATEWASEVPF